MAVEREPVEVRHLEGQALGDIRRQIEGPGEGGKEILVPAVLRRVDLGDEHLEVGAVGAGRLDVGPIRQHLVGQRVEAVQVREQLGIGRIRRSPLDVRVDADPRELFSIDLRELLHPGLRVVLAPHAGPQGEEFGRRVYLEDRRDVGVDQVGER